MPPFPITSARGHKAPAYMRLRNVLIAAVAARLLAQTANGVHDIVRLNSIGLTESRDPIPIGVHPAQQIRVISQGLNISIATGGENLIQDVVRIQRDRKN